jgi:HD superfamily phosphohydrolase
VACPAIMRLREVRMANINFLRFPGFADSSRFEHSLGTTYLASVAAKKLGLGERDMLTLMAAALYHDAATPPFAHALEEVFHDLYGFNHEEKIGAVLSGSRAATTYASGMHVPIFTDRRCILPTICQARPFRHLDIDPIEIGQIINGSGPLGALIKSDLDLDNIDNVIRAAAHMGLAPDPLLPVTLATSFVVSDSTVMLAPDSEIHINQWQSTRWKLYTRIFEDIEDFSLQTMLKYSVSYAIECGVLGPDDWVLTDYELVFRLREGNDTLRHLMDRLRMADIFEPIFVRTLALNSASSVITNKDSRRAIEAYVEAETGIPLTINYYIDKRERIIRKATIDARSDTQSKPQKTKTSPVIIIGGFTPSRQHPSGRMKGRIWGLVQRRLSSSGPSTEESQLALDLPSS